MDTNAIGHFGNTDDIGSNVLLMGCMGTDPGATMVLIQAHGTIAIAVIMVYLILYILSFVYSYKYGYVLKDLLQNYF